MKKLIIVLLIACPVLADDFAAILGSAVKVVDGDTLDVKTDGEAMMPDGSKMDMPYRFRVRLIGIDTPEKDNVSTERLRDLTANGFVVLFVVSTLEGEKLPLTDKYGRVLGVLILDLETRESANDILLKEGCAKPFMSHKNAELSYLERKVNEKKMPVQEVLPPQGAEKN